MNVINHGKDYDPYQHATEYKVQIVYRVKLPNPEWVACYSEDLRAIFVKTNLSSIVEHCAIAHEMAHFENVDTRSDKLLESRADIRAARRLIPIEKYQQAWLSTSGDLNRTAEELRVTLNLLKTFIADLENRDFQKFTRW